MRVRRYYFIIINSIKLFVKVDTHDLLYHDHALRIMESVTTIFKEIVSEYDKLVEAQREMINEFKAIVESLP